MARKVQKIGIAAFLLVVACITFGLLAMQGFREVASLRPGMAELHLPSGATLYVRRQSYMDRPAEVYLSANNDFCKPYDSWHDIKVLDPVHGGSESPLLISYEGDKIILHSPKAPRMPIFFKPKNFTVAFQPIVEEDYVSYISMKALPPGWERVEIPFGHNTCAP